MGPFLPGSSAAPKSWVELLRKRASEHGARVASRYIGDGEVDNALLTYVDLERQALAIAARLQREGAAGERALLFYPSGIEFLAAFCGCLVAGVVAVPVFPARLPRHLPRLAAIAADAQPKFVLTASRLRGRAEALCQQEATFRASRWISTDNISPDLANDWRDPEAQPETLAFLQYTSGSTTTPRGVMVSHGNLLHNSASIQRIFGFHEETLGLTWLPHYHDMGLIGGLLQPLYSGCTSLVMPPASFLQRPARWLEAATRYKATNLVAPNFAYELCVEKIAPAERAALHLDSVETALCGAEPIRAGTLERFAEAFEPCGFRRSSFRPAYGLAEATLIVSGERGNSGAVTHSARAGQWDRDPAKPSDGNGAAPRRLVGCGEPAPDTQIVIVDSESRVPCDPGTVGEIWVAGPGVARGYWQRPAETAEVFNAHTVNGDGPLLRTGDLGFLSEGRLIVTGRLKDLIIVRERTTMRMISSIPSSGVTARSDRDAARHSAWMCRAKKASRSSKK